MSHSLLYPVMEKDKCHGALQAYLTQRSCAQEFSAQVSELWLCWVQNSAPEYLAVSATLRVCLRALKHTHPEQATSLATQSLALLAEVDTQTHTPCQQYRPSLWQGCRCNTNLARRVHRTCQDLKAASLTSSALEANAKRYGECLVDPSLSPKQGSAGTLPVRL